MKLALTLFGANCGLALIALAVPELAFLCVALGVVSAFGAATAGFALKVRILIGAMLPGARRRLFRALSAASLPVSNTFHRPWRWFFHIPRDTNTTIEQIAEAQKELVQFYFSAIGAFLGVLVQFIVFARPFLLGWLRGDLMPVR